METMSYDVTMSQKASCKPAAASDPIAFLNGRTRLHAKWRRVRRERYAIVMAALGERDWELGIQQRLAQKLGVSEVSVHRYVYQLRAAGLLPPKDMPYEQWRLSQAMQAISQSLDKRDDEMAALRAEVSELRARLAAEKQTGE